MVSLREVNGKFVLHDSSSDEEVGCSRLEGDGSNEGSDSEHGDSSEGEFDCYDHATDELEMTGPSRLERIYFEYYPPTSLPDPPGMVDATGWTFKTDEQEAKEKTKQETASRESSKSSVEKPFVHTEVSKSPDLKKVICGEWNKKTLDKEVSAVLGKEVKSKVAYDSPTPLGWAGVLLTDSEAQIVRERLSITVEPFAAFPDLETPVPFSRKEELGDYVYIMKQSSGGLTQAPLAPLVVSRITNSRAVRDIARSKDLLDVVQQKGLLTTTFCFVDFEFALIAADGEVYPVEVGAARLSIAELAMADCEHEGLGGIVMGDLINPGKIDPRHLRTLLKTFDAHRLPHTDAEELSTDYEGIYTRLCQFWQDSALIIKGRKDSSTDVNGIKWLKRAAEQASGKTLPDVPKSYDVYDLYNVIAALHFKVGIEDVPWFENDAAFSEFMNSSYGEKLLEWEFKRMLGSSSKEPGQIVCSLCCHFHAELVEDESLNYPCPTLVHCALRDALVMPRTLPSLIRNFPNALAEQGLADLPRFIEVNYSPYYRDVVTPNEAEILKLAKSRTRFHQRWVLKEPVEDSSPPSRTSSPTAHDRGEEEQP